MAEEAQVAVAPPKTAALPPNQKTVWFEKKGEDGKTYSGNFVFRRLTVAGVGAVGAEIARRNLGLKVDPTTDLINTMLAHFRFCIAKAPDWFDPENLYDLGLMREVFDAIMAHEESFRPAAPGQDQAAPSAG